MQGLSDNSSDENRIIIIEPSIKSSESRDLLKESATGLLESIGIKIQSINTEGYFIILRLHNTSLNVNAIDILKTVPGVSFIFIGIAIERNYNTILNTVITLCSKRLVNGGTYFLKMTTATPSTENEKSILDQFDMEFNLCSVLSSSFIGSIRVENDRKADVVIYILLSSSRSYISMIVFRGKYIMPINHLQDRVLCPIFDNISMITFVKVMNSGYNPIPLFFFKRRHDLKKLLKVFENIVASYPIDLIEIYLISIENDFAEWVQKICARDTKKVSSILNTQSFHRLIFCLSKLYVMEEANVNFKMMALPLTAYTHPRWLIKEIMTLFGKSGTMVLTPLLFNYSSQTFEKDIYELTKNGLGFDPHQNVSLDQMAESDPEEFTAWLRNLSNNSFQSNSKYRKKFTLRIREDDILDIFNSI